MFKKNIKKIRKNIGITPAWRLNIRKCIEFLKQHEEKLYWHDINVGRLPIEIEQFGDLIIARKDISAGQHVHVDNTDFKSTDHEYEFSTSVRLPNMIEPENRVLFKGYKRPNGKVGTRNYIGILTSVNCSATAAKNISVAFTKDKLKSYPNVDGVVSFTHGSGCGSNFSGDGFEALQRVLLGYIPVSYTHLTLPTKA